MTASTITSVSDRILPQAPSRPVPATARVSDLPPGEARDILSAYGELSARRSAVLRPFAAELRSSRPELSEEAKEELAMRCKAGHRASDQLAAMLDEGPPPTAVQRAALRAAAVNGERCGHQLLAAVRNLLVTQVNDHIHKVPKHKKSEVRTRMLNGAMVQLAAAIDRYEASREVPFTRYASSIVRSNLRQMLHQLVDDALVQRPLEATLVSRRAYILMKEIETDSRNMLREGIGDGALSRRELLSRTQDALVRESNEYTYSRLADDAAMTEDEKWAAAEEKNRKSGRLGHISRLGHTVRASRSEASLDVSVSDDDESSLGSMLSTDASPTAVAEAGGSVADLLEGMLTGLTAEQWEVTTRYFGLHPSGDEPATYQSLSVLMDDMTPSRAKTVLTEAISVMSASEFSAELASVYGMSTQRG